MPKRIAVLMPDWSYIVPRLPMVLISSLISASAVVLFLIPGQIVPGGVTGIGIILEELLGVPVGVVVFIGNIIMLAIGYRYLGGWNTVILTVIFATLLSVNIELLGAILPTQGLTDDRFMNALYAGIVSGVAGGIVYRAGGTVGGTGVLSRILLTKFGIPTSTGYLYVDSLIIVAGGFAFGAETPLFALVTVVIDGMIADYVLEGPSVIRTVTIITNKAEDVSNAVMSRLYRGVTSWEGTGRYTEKRYDVLFITVGRSQVTELRDIVNEVDPAAFMVVGQGHVAYGGGFKSKGRVGRIPVKLPSLRTVIRSTAEVPAVTTASTASTASTDPPTGS